MLKIRLMRIGAKKRPFYRVVVVDERNKRNGAYIENVGTYDPMTTPHEVKLNKERIDYWLKQGAQKSDGFLRILGEAPQRPPRKPKKEKKESPAILPTSGGPQSSEEKQEKVEEAAAEESTSEVVQPATSEVEEQKES